MITPSPSSSTHTTMPSPPLVCDEFAWIFNHTTFHTPTSIPTSNCLTCSSSPVFNICVHFSRVCGPYVVTFINGILCQYFKGRLLSILMTSVVTNMRSMLSFLESYKLKVQLIILNNNSLCFHLPCAQVPLVTTSNSPNTNPIPMEIQFVVIQLFYLNKRLLKHLSYIQQIVVNIKYVKYIIIYYITLCMYIDIQWNRLVLFWQFLWVFHIYLISWHAILSIHQTLEVMDHIIKGL